MQFTGTITRKMPPLKINTSKGENLVQTFELTYEQGIYNKKVAFDVFGAEKIKEFAINLNEQLVCQIDFDTSEYNGRLFNRVKCWKVERMAQTQTSQPHVQQANPNASYQSQAAPVQPPQQAEDLPF